MDTDRDPFYWVDHAERCRQAAYRRGVQDGRKQAADEVFAAIHEVEKEAASQRFPSLQVLGCLRRRLSHLFLSSPPPQDPPP